MKYFLITLALVVGITYSVPALAATISFTPSSLSVTQGQTLRLNVAINPETSTVYTVKSEIRFPSDLLEVQSFNFGNGWMPLVQLGYDTTDNVNGVLIKTGGFPGGLSGAANLGTITFKAKKTGSATVSVSENSVGLDANSSNPVRPVFGGAMIVITAPAAVKASHATSAGDQLEKASTSAAGRPLTAAVAATENERPLPWGTIAPVLILAIIAIFLFFRYRDRLNRTK